MNDEEQQRKVDRLTEVAESLCIELGFESVLLLASGRSLNESSETQYKSSAGSDTLNYGLAKMYVIEREARQQKWAFNEEDKDV